MPKRTGDNKKISTLLVDGQVAINNALANPEILTIIAPYSYTKSELQQAQNLLNDANEMTLLHLKVYGDKLAATERFQIAFKEGMMMFANTLKISKIVFKGDIQATLRLRLKDKRKQAYDKWMEHASSYYSSLLTSERLLDKVQPYSLTKDNLQAEQKKLQNINKLYEEHLQYTGEALSMTQKRNQAVKKFEDWHNKFVKIVKIALKNAPSLLKELGII